MEGALERIDYLVIGHVTVDQTSDGPRPGGTATYSTLTARALGRRPGLVTAAGPSAPDSALASVPTICIPSAHSTTFENVYRDGRRTQFVRAVAESIPVKAIPTEWRATSIVHLAPVAQEVAREAVGLFDDSFVGLTPQGWLRAWGPDGRVRPAEWREAGPWLRAASAVVISQEDLSGDRGAIGRWAAEARLLAVTAGAGGATIFWQGKTQHFPAPAVREVDPTGAGDIFAASYFVRFQETGDAWQAARFAVRLASASVERRGLAGIPTAVETAAARQHDSP